MFKEGDFVIVKPGTTLDSGQKIFGWGGKVEEVYEEEKTCFITFDAQTIDSLEDEYLEESIEQGAESFNYIFGFGDLEIAERRDTDEQWKEAYDRLIDRELAIEGYSEDDEFSEYDELVEKWAGEFESSRWFESMDGTQKENANFIVDSFMNHMYNYCYVSPAGWKGSQVREICLDIVPSKLVGDDDLFENYGDVLVQFFSFLDDKEYISNAPSLIREVKAIKNMIPKRAKNSKYWGIGKSLLMSGQKEGFDMSTQDGLDKALVFHQARLIADLEKEEQSIKRKVDISAFKDIGKNQRITVKYSDGRIVENVKFKKVEGDLKNGICEWIKE